MAPDPSTPIPTVAGTVREQLQALATSAADSDSHGVALEALRELSKKPGWATTEFYLSLALGAFGAVLTQMPGKELVGALLSAAAILSYNLSRGIAKKAAAIFLAALMSTALTGCSSPGFQAAEADVRAALGEVDSIATQINADPVAAKAAVAKLAALAPGNTMIQSFAAKSNAAIDAGDFTTVHVLSSSGVVFLTPTPKSP
jgi:hypothetical protein